MHNGDITIWGGYMMSKILNAITGQLWAGTLSQPHICSLQIKWPLLSFWNSHAAVILWMTSTTGLIVMLFHTAKYQFSKNQTGSFKLESSVFPILLFLEVTTTTGRSISWGLVPTPPLQAQHRLCVVAMGREFPLALWTLSRFCHFSASSSRKQGKVKLLSRVFSVIRWS